MKTAVVVGVGPGIGRSVALKFSKEGFKVGLISRTEQNLLPVHKEILQTGGISKFYCADVSEESQMKSTFQEIVKDLGNVEVLVYNAAARRFKLQNTLQVSSEEFLSFWKINCFGAFLCSRQVLPWMLQQRKGTILLTGATGSLRSLGGLSSFSVGKFGLRAFAQSLAREFAKEGIHVAHIIVDGPVNKPLVRNFIEKTVGNKVPVTDDLFLNPDEIANQYWNLYCQHRSVWTLELDLRPFKEKVYSAM